MLHMATATTPDRDALATFEQFAPFYDVFTAHHDYEAWMSSLEALALRHGLEGRRLLDVATGTGKSFLPMLRRGYRVTACDSSAAMLERAATKAGEEVELLVADMRELPPLGPFDLVTCIDEPLNYLLEEADLAAAFRSVAECLRPGGIYLFDVNTLHAYRSLFSADSCHELDGWLFIWRGESGGDLAPRARAEATIEAFRELDDGRWERASNRHVQRHFPRELIQELLAEAGLQHLAAYGQFPDGRLEPEPDEETHTKTIHVARRAA
jgi:SAM-dependent methyltransferase